MPLRRPTAAQIQALGNTLGMSLTAGESEAFVRMLEGTFDAYDQVDAMPDHLPRYVSARAGPSAGGGRQSDNAGHPDQHQGRGHGAVRQEGRIKDNICLAGVPMSIGTGYLEGYVPEVDATVVTRILDAGGETVGKAVCEDLCFSGSSHTSWPAPVLNPLDPTRSAGGSSSGSAVVVATGEADMALGGDQGGSIRIPAAWCGIVGLKPTYGLVPYTGIFPVELTIDHVGPMTEMVGDKALLLEVIAGAEGSTQDSTRPTPRPIPRPSRTAIAVSASA